MIEFLEFDNLSFYKWQGIGGITMNLKIFNNKIVV